MTPARFDELRANAESDSVLLSASDVIECLDEVARLASLVYIPGAFYCPKCKFGLVKSVLYLKSGTVGVGHHCDEKCPNDDTPAAGTKPDISTLEWWTTREVGNRYGYDDSTIRRWCEAGKIKAAKMPNGTWRIHSTVVESLGAAGMPPQERVGRDAPAEFQDAPDNFDDSPNPKARVRT